MSNIKFTRDEVLLALDVLYLNGEGYQSHKNEKIIELSALLRTLPIHHEAENISYFRTPSGIAKQLNYFLKESKEGIRKNAGSMFFEVALEYDGHHEELHAIAEAIRKNTETYKMAMFGADMEGENFPEGALLGHLHRYLERRDSARILAEGRCAVCQIETTSIYDGEPNLLEWHLTVPITKIDGNKRYKPIDFIAVCPNCHAALHRRRPWLSKDESNKVLC